MSFVPPSDDAVPISQESARKPYKIEITEVTDANGDGRVDLSDVEYLLKNHKNNLTLLDGDGDFRSQECIELMKQADVIVTNPPFSLFRDFVAQLVKYEKYFLIIGNINAITYKEVFPLIMQNRIWLGASIHSGDREFRVPDSYPLNASGCRIDENSIKYIRVKGVRWFTNIDYEKRHEDLILYKHYTPEEYPKYDNYDAINVDKTAEIPCDYYGVMGVPISFLDKYNPEQFEIVAFRKGNDGKDLVYSFNDCSQSVNVERERGGRCGRTSAYSSDADHRIVRRRDSSSSKWQETISENYYPYSTAIPGLIKNAEGKINGKITYARLTIRRKQGQNNENKIT